MLPASPHDGSSASVLDGGSAPVVAQGSARVVVSSFCSDGVCVGVVQELSGVAVVDTKDPAGAPLRFTRAEWAAFVTGVKNGEFDLAADGPDARS